MIVDKKLDYVVIQLAVGEEIQLFRHILADVGTGKRCGEAEEYLADELYAKIYTERG